MWSELEKVEQEMYGVEQDCKLLVSEHRDALERIKTDAANVKSQTYRLNECNAEELHKYQVRLGNLLNQSDQSKSAIDMMRKQHPWIGKFNSLVEKRDGIVRKISSELSELKSYETRVQSTLSEIERIEKRHQLAMRSLSGFDFLSIHSLIGIRKYEEVLAAAGLAILSDVRGFPFIGATQAINANLRQNIEASLTRLYVQNNPTVPIDDIIESVKLQTDAYMRQFTIEDNDLAVSISVKAPQKIAKPKQGLEMSGYVTKYIGDTYSSKFNGISINAKNASDYLALCKDLENEEARGASPKGCNSVNYLINHEIAHQLDSFLDLSSDADIIREYKRHVMMSEEDQVANVCTYASTDIHEFIAEAWAESQCSSTPREIAKLIGEKVSIASITYMKAKKGDDDYVRELEL